MPSDKITKKIVFVFLILIFLVFFVSGVNSFKETDRSKVRVFVSVKDEKKSFFSLQKVKLTAEEKQELEQEVIKEISENTKNSIRHDFSDGFSAEISEQDVENLKQDSSIEIIKMNTLQLFLQDSTGLINATSAWQTKINGTSLTGQYESVCLIDTGVDFSHPDLIGKNFTCNINCITQNCVENCSVTDDHGHGTHVAGIIAANGSIKGIAPDAKIVAVKVLDSAGSGSPDDLKSGIDWCISNSLAYNISVISMSLGCNATKDGYISYCDSEADGCLSNQLAVSVNNATSKNISVIAATGNYANFSAIASPACIENTTAVAATDKSDNLWNYNRNSLTDLIAPGISINSTSISGAYEQLSGTSMAAPHVAAAFALVRQFKRLEKNEVLKPSEIQDALNSTGRRINDASSGLNFSRVDIYSAILSLDETAPNITLIQPTHNMINSSQNYTFRCNATDLQLKNITLYVWNSSGLYYNATESASGTFAEREFNLTNMPLDTYRWNCLAADNRGNNAFATSNFSLTIGNILVNLVSPENNSFTNSAKNFTCNATTIAGTSLENITFYLWNSSSSLINTTTTNISGLQNSTTFSYNFTAEQEYKWNCLSINNESNKSFAETNFTITYDVTLPTINLTNPVNSSTYTTSNTIDFFYNVTDTNSMANCSLVVNKVVNKTVENPNKGVTNNITVYLANTIYNWSINCTDAANNQNVSQTRILTVLYTPSQSQQQTGGGSGVVAAKTYTITEKQFLGGYTQMLSVKDKIKFSIGEEEHVLELNETTDNSATIKISSSVITVALLINEIKKFNFSSAGYYDLQVKLNSIANKKANLTISGINEPVKTREDKTEKGEEKENNTNKIIAFNETEHTTGESSGKKMLLFILGIILIIMAFLVISTKKDKKSKRSKKTKK